MSFSIFTCPPSAVLPTLGNPDCPVMFGNVQAIVLQLYQAVPTLTSVNIGTLATWTPLLAAATATGARVIQATNFETTPGEPITEGGNDQTTYKGRPKPKHVGFTTASFVLDGITPALAKTISGFTQFGSMAGGRSKLRAFFLTDENYILSAPDFNGIEIWNFIVQDSKLGGEFKPTNKYPVTFGMDYQWAIEMVGTKASFDILTLVNA